MAQFARPVADAFIGAGWTDEGGATVNLFESIDEVSASDADYVEGPDAAAVDVYVCDLGSVTDPEVSTGHVVRYRYAKSAAAGDQVDLDVELREGYVNEGTPGTLIVLWSHVNITDTWVTAAQTLTGPQTDAITNYADLSLRFIAEP